MLTNKAIADALRQAIRGEHPGLLNEADNTINMSVELAREIADTLDPPTKPDWRESVKSRKEP